MTTKPWGQIVTLSFLVGHVPSGHGRGQSPGVSGTDTSGRGA
jgi:hypothetical protein